jgi:hypothetical protein
MAELQEKFPAHINSLKEQNKSNDIKLMELENRLNLLEKEEETAVEEKKTKLTQQQFVAFDVYRVSYYQTAGTTIPYEAALYASGGGMSIATGIFTAPVPGAYFFSFYCDILNGARVEIYHQVPNNYAVKVASIFGAGSTNGGTIITFMNVGGKVFTYLADGTLQSAPDERACHFSGHLIHSYQ